MDRKGHAIFRSTNCVKELTVRKLSSFKSCRSIFIRKLPSKNRTSCIAKSELTKPPAKMSSSFWRSWFWMYVSRKALILIIGSSISRCLSKQLFLTALTPWRGWNRSLHPIVQSWTLWLGRIFVKTLPAFTPVQSSLNHLYEQGAGAILAITKAFEKDLNRVKDCI